MKHFIFLGLTLFGMLSVSGQTTFCPNDPPLNPWLADSPYPIYHRNNYVQASTCISGITPTDSVVIKTRTSITGGPSPWIYFSDEYPNGERAILYSNSNFVFKFVDNGTQIITVDSLRIDFDPNTNGYNHLLTKNKIWFTYDNAFNPAQNRFSRLFKLTDADTTNAYSSIIAIDTLNFGDFGIPKVSMYSLNYNGEIVFYSDINSQTNTFSAGIIDQNLNMLNFENFAVLPNETVSLNSIAVDENNSFYIVTSHRLIKFDWDGDSVTMGWQALYDFVNDGPTGNFANGSGTTPTLMGWGNGNDKIVVVADGHANSNLVAFWRELPPNWTGLPGMDIRFADSIQIPFAQSTGNLFKPIENSPTAYGYDIAIAQYNGFFAYPCVNAKGVQKFRWDTVSNQFNLQWATDSINMNGVLSYSAGSNLLYGSGKENDCNYYYYGLNWDNGNLELRILLGAEGNFPDDPFFDQGNNNIIAEDGSIYFSGSRSLVKLERIQTPSSIENNLNSIKQLILFPNPTNDLIYITDSALEGWSYSIIGLDGKVYLNDKVIGGTLNTSSLTSGLYIVKITNGIDLITRKIMKNGL